MAKNTKSKSKNNPEFERTKDAFRQILSVPKEKLDEMKKGQSAKPPEKPEKDCK